jgi:hypothetical protein
MVQSRCKSVIQQLQLASLSCDSSQAVAFPLESSKANAFSYHRTSEYQLGWLDSTTTGHTLLSFARQMLSCYIIGLKVLWH